MPVEESDEAVAEQVQVADGVQHLVLDELVLVPQPVLVEDTVVVHDDGVVEVTAESEVVVAQALQIAHESERPRTADFLHEGGGRKVHRRLAHAPVKGGMVELDRERDLEALERFETRPLVPVLHGYRLPDSDELLGRVLLLDAGRLNQEYERTGAAVHDRHFRCAHVHVRVVDAESRHGREQVLDSGHTDVTAAQRGGERGVPDVLGTCLDLHHDIQIDPAEYDSGIRRSGPERQVDLAATVKSDARGPDDVLQRTLPDHRVCFPCRLGPMRSFSTCHHAIPALWERAPGEARDGRHSYVIYDATIKSGPARYEVRRIGTGFPVRAQHRIGAFSRAACAGIPGSSDSRCPPRTSEWAPPGPVAFE